MTHVSKLFYKVQTYTILFLLNFLYILTLYIFFNRKNFSLDSHMSNRSKDHGLLMMHHKQISMTVTSLGHDVG